MPHTRLSPQMNEQPEKICEIAGDSVHQCMQCGTCTGVCPLAPHMSIRPREVMLLLQRGLVDRVMESEMAWLCASCLNCEVNCPRNIDIPALMEALRQTVLRENRDRLHPNSISKEDLADLPPIALVTAFRKLTG